MNVDWPTVFQGIRAFLDPLAEASWPIGMLAIAWIFRSPISDLINRVKQAHVGGTSLVFDRKARVQQQSESSDEPDLGKTSENALEAVPIGLPQPDADLSPLDDELRQMLDEKVPDVADKLAWAIRERSISEVKRIHSINYSSIFGSQVFLLQRLDTTGPIPVSDVENYFNEMKANPVNVDVHQDRDFASWINFLLNANYVEPAPDKEPQELQIASFGRQFLLWMFAEKLSPYRLG